LKTYYFENALLPQGWAKGVRVSVNDQGWIDSVSENTEKATEDTILDCVIPAMPNCHSHVFQRAMAGLTEYKTSKNDSFWSWRDLMYKYANQISADQLYEIARYCYSEMLEAGYASVCEFHYIHRDLQDNSNYLNMSKAILRAAYDVGIGMTLLPVLYTQAHIDGSELSELQQRFKLSVDEYVDLYQQLDNELFDDQNLGICFHSLRAVSIEQMQQVLDKLDQGQPIHIHIAEQQIEIDQILKHSGLRPVELLYKNFDVKDNWCLVHATHLNENEIQLIADSNAVAGICPLTEANLGDGIFPLPEFMTKNGLFAIGSDSHILINPFQELQILEYSQRLNRQQRIIASTKQTQNVGEYLWNSAVHAGAQSCQLSVNGIAKGQRANWLSLDTNHPLLTNLKPQSCLDTAMFASQNLIHQSYIDGQKFTGMASELQESYKKCLKALR
jgi:formimidoylglutamate deiminase